jgi:hypothetical protein
MSWSLETPSPFPVSKFQPRLPERYCEPTRLANLIWTRWPSLDNPLPEIFAERIWGGEFGMAPAATPGCTKVLLIGGQWPVPCAPLAIPSFCDRPNSLCYANRAAGGYDFVQVAPPYGVMAFAQRRAWVWDAASKAAVESILRRVRWRDLRLMAQSAPGAMVRAAHEVSWTHGLQSDNELVVYVAEPRPGASLTLRLPGAMAGWLLDPETGNEIRAIRVDGPAREISRLSLPPGPAVVVLLRRLS